MATISVIIPLYNKRDKIRRTILSVLNQTYKDFDAIVIDDGSNDDSLFSIQDIKPTLSPIFDEIEIR
ncbi:MAG: glycosyltransferase [Muribaculum sp.]|nr:glycosyltransferase [Muribaculum sp.]